MNAETKPAKHSAPGQYLGFALQPVRVFYHLLTSPKGAKVSLEFKDDVAVHHADGKLLLDSNEVSNSRTTASTNIDTYNNWVAMDLATNTNLGLSDAIRFVTSQGCLTTAN